MYIFSLTVQYSMTSLIKLSHPNILYIYTVLAIKFTSTVCLTANNCKIWQMIYIEQIEKYCSVEA